MTKDPKRLIESESGPLAQSLAAAQLRLPSQARLAALAERLASTGVVLAEPARPPALRELTRAPSALPAKSLELSLKAVLAALALGVAAVGGAVFWRYGVPHTPANSSPATLAQAAPLELAPAPVSPQEAPAALPSPAPALARLAQAPAALPPPAALPAEADVHVDSEPPVSAAATTAHAEQEANAETTRPAPARAPTKVEPKRAALSVSSPRTDGAASRGELPANTVVDSEVETLKKARSALSGDPLQAFALTERCRAQYPSGAFAQEREFIAISALIRMGRLDEARGRASLFRTHYRNSAYLPQLTRMLGEE